MTENKFKEEGGKLICVQHMKEIFFISLEVENFNSSLFCSRCIDESQQFTKIVTLDKVKDLMNQQSQDQQQMLNCLKFSITQELERFDKSLLSIEKALISKLDKLKLSMKCWREQISHIGKENNPENKNQNILLKLQTFFNNQNINFEQKLCQEIITMNKGFYNQVYNEINELQYFNLQNHQTQLEQLFNITSEKFRHQKLIKLIPTQKASQEPFTFPIKCNQHNQLITHIDTYHCQDAKKCFKCNCCATQGSIPVKKFSEIFNLFNEKKWNSLIYERSTIIQKLSKIKQILNQLREQYLDFTRSSLKQVEDFILEEINIQFQQYDGQLTNDSLLKIVQEQSQFQKQVIPNVQMKRISIKEIKNMINLFKNKQTSKLLQHKMSKQKQWIFQKKIKIFKTNLMQKRNLKKKKSKILQEIKLQNNQIIMKILTTYLIKSWMKQPY